MNPVITLIIGCAISLLSATYLRRKILQMGDGPIVKTASNLLGLSAFAVAYCLVALFSIFAFPGL